MIEGSGSDVADGGIITALVDPKSTATAILRLLRSPDLRNSMGMVIRDRVQREYQWQDIVERYRQFYPAYL